MLRWIFVVIFTLLAFVTVAAQPIERCGNTQTPCWTTANRPSNPGVGTEGFNLDLLTIEWWDGSNWRSPNAITAPVTAIGPLGPNGGAFRTQESPLAQSGSDDFVLFSKNGNQGFPVPTLQPWGTAGIIQNLGFGTGGIGFLSNIVGGSGYVPGVYTNVPLTCVSCAAGGTGAFFNITVDGTGAVSAIGDPFNLGTNFRIGDIVSASSANLGGSGSGFQAEVINYAASLALDLLPLGYVPNRNLPAGNGIVWEDMCNRDITYVFSNFSCTHHSTFNNGDAFYGVSAFGQTGQRILFGSVVGGAYNWIYEDGRFHAQEGTVRGFGTSLSTSVASEDFDSNTLVRSNDFANASWTKSSVNVTATCCSAVEDPWGTATAQTLANTVNGEYIFQATTVANDSKSYTASVYVNSTSNPNVTGSGGFFLITLSFTGGTRVDYTVLLTPSVGALGIVGTTPVGCASDDGGPSGNGRTFKPDSPRCFGIERVQVGCQSGCTSATTQTWWRLWVTGSNNSTGNTTATMAINPAFGGTATGTAIIAGAQLSPRNYLLPHIPTVTAAVTRTPGPVATKVFFTSNSATATGAGATNFYAVGCAAAAQTCQGVFTSSGTLRNLYMTVQTAAGVGQSYTNTLMAGTGATPAATTITCAISGAAATTCNDVTNAARVAAGDTFDVRVVGSAGAAGTGAVTFGFEMTTP